MVDYSRFDKIIDEDSDDDVIQKTPIKPLTPSLENTTNNTPVKLTPKGKNGRFKFEYENRTIYEWEQSLEEINIYLEPPPGVTREMIDITISHRHLKIGLKSAPPFIDEDTGGPVKVAESFWMLSDNEININLQKMNKAERWETALKGHLGQQKMDSFTVEEEKKKLMLERFQEEHPAFDFSNADFNGSIPDAREFMGGMRFK